jgi:signal transduction histidine kinase
VTRPTDTYLHSASWATALESYAAVSRLTVKVYDTGHRPILASVHPTPLVGLLSGDHDPGLFDACLDRALGQPPSPAVVHHQHGLAVVGTAFTLDDEVVAGAVAGYALTEFPQTLAIERLARASGLPFQAVWEVVRREVPMAEWVLVRAGQLLRVLGEALLKEAHRTQQQEEISARLAEAAGAKDRFLSIVSHELRAPLSPILTWAQTLKRAPTPTRVQQAAEAIERNARFQARLVDDLLQLNRIAQGKMSLALAPHDLRDVLRGVGETLREAAQRKGIQVEWTEPGERVSVEADRERLEQVFGNLLSNAVKFTPVGGTIQVTLARDVQTAIVKVRDTGIGISPEFLPSVFEMFRQAEEGDRREYGGLGIGLALAKRLTEDHQGTIEVTSEGPGRGTEATVRLPLTKWLAAPDAGLGLPEASLVPLQGLAILSIEDDPDASDAAKLLLEALGARVLPARNGLAALAILPAEEPAVILCDLRMPGMDGFEFLATLRRNPRRAGIPVVAVSGLATPADLRRTREAGFAAHVSKPFDVEQLVAALETAMRPQVA